MANQPSALLSRQSQHLRAGLAIRAAGRLSPDQPVRPVLPLQKPLSPELPVRARSALLPGREPRHFAQ
ncbi:MAG TPA: hypothetical protein VGM05_24055 [Planctomycetaceae bacterium]